jgi:hypothetical protein
VGLYDGFCDRKAQVIVRSYYGSSIELRCWEHATCGESGCKSTQLYFDPEAMLPYYRCFEHFDSGDEAESRRQSREGPE